MTSLVTVMPLHAQVSESTRAAVAELQASDPAFKLKTVHRDCLSGKDTDSECESIVNTYVTNYKDRKMVDAERAQVDAERAQVDAREAQLVVVGEISGHLDIALAMLQLANYVEFNEPIPAGNKNMVAAVLASPTAPLEVKNFLEGMLAKKKAGTPVPYNPERKQLLEYVETHTNTAMNLMGKLTIKNNTYDILSRQIAVMRQNHTTIA